MRFNVKSIVLFNVILLLCFLTLTYLNIIHVSHKGVQWQLDTGGNPYCEVPCALQRAAFIPSSCRPTWADCTSPQYHVHTLHITAGLYRASHISSNTALLSNIAKQSQMRCDSWPRSVFVRYFETAVISWARPSLSSSSHFRDRDPVLQLHSGYTCSMYTAGPSDEAWNTAASQCSDHGISPESLLTICSRPPTVWWTAHPGDWVQSEHSAGVVLLQTWLLVINTDHTIVRSSRSL